MLSDLTGSFYRVVALPITSIPSPLATQRVSTLLRYACVSFHRLKSAPTLPTYLDPSGHRSPHRTPCVISDCTFYSSYLISPGRLSEWPRYKQTVPPPSGPAALSVRAMPLSLPGMPEILSRPLYQGTALLRSGLGSLTWGPALRVARPAILSVLSSIETGTLLLFDEPTGQRFVYGQKLGPSKLDNLTADYDLTQLVSGVHQVRKATTIPRVELVVKSEAFWMRLLLFADMGFAEAYMLGEVECADLTAFFQLFIVNREQMGNGTTWMSSASSAIAGLARSTNTLSNALLNIQAHYDISNDMFAAFLSPDMTYSCPVWQHMHGSEVEEESLEAAQLTKLHRFIDGAKIKSTDHVLEIGTGWGSFAIEAVRKTGCRITSLTLSQEQKTLAEERIAEAGFSDRIDVLLMDYRALPVPETPYDKIVSIEMLEAVGKEFLGTYFACVNRLLKPNGGVAMFQCITMPEGRHEAYSKGEE